MAGPTQDPIKPVAIEHSIDEIRADGRSEQRYRVFDYHLERGNVYCRARSYADARRQVVVYGPFAARGDLRANEDAVFTRAVRAYLQRRYPTGEGR